NVAGGLRISEPAADLAAAAALLTAHTGQPLGPETVVFGEISLTGALRPVAQTEGRLREAAKLGFARALIPEVPRPTTSRKPPQIDTGATSDAADGPVRLTRVADLASFATTIGAAG
ncbi:MAG: magnesium chelatase domain-containing protein, partial [Pseudomonadota bacterium]